MAGQRQPIELVLVKRMVDFIRKVSEIDHFCVGLRNRAEKNGNRPIRGISSGML